MPLTPPPSRQRIDVLAVGGQIRTDKSVCVLQSRQESTLRSQGSPAAASYRTCTQFSQIQCPHVSSYWGLLVRHVKQETCVLTQFHSCVNRDMMSTWTEREDWPMATLSKSDFRRSCTNLQKSFGLMMLEQSAYFLKASCTADWHTVLYSVLYTSSG
jgi:hypothetical protein